jgi:putative CocE/NonD family hydrolase
VPVVERDLRVPMDDGAVLLADRYAPRAAGPMPTVLVRSPYGRRGFYGVLYGSLFAQQGLQVVIQSTRGTFGSEGRFEPFVERADGLATLAWLQQQPWHAGKVGMAGASYLGLVQWAVAAAVGDALGAIAPTVSASQFHGAAHGGAPALESLATWHAMVAEQERPLAPLRMAAALRRLRRAYEHLPLAELDERFAGRAIPAFREALGNHDAASPYWAARDHGADVAHIQAPVLLVAGWHDIFTPWQLEDYLRLGSARRRARLVVGPWTHTSQGMWARSTRESIRWLRGHLVTGRPPRAGVRVYVSGAREWRDFRDWPPPEASEHRLFLHPGGALSPDPPGDSEPDRYTFDPANPTPARGGPVLLSRRPVVDNAPLERRPDVLTYTTPALDHALEVVGPARVCIHVRSTLQYFDVFARLCDVDRWRVSRNVCDALARVDPEEFAWARDGSVAVEFALWPTAHRFERGHRIRLQVSSGAHPRYARNPGTGESHATASRLVPAHQEVFHDSRHPSVLVLSVLAESAGAVH